MDKKLPLLLCTSFLLSACAAAKPESTSTPVPTPKPSPTAEWAFDHPCFIILNLAVGGRWPGYPDDTMVFPQFLYVDYVRVYQKP